jgi:SAM-dependent methyltransferase
MGDLDAVRRNWDAFGEADPLWAVLSWPDKQHGGWKIDEFLATAQHELDLVLARVAELVPEEAAAAGRDRALDFGCGVGRLTLALADRYARCDGVDIAESMISRARELASTNGVADRVQYHLNDTSGLTMFGDDAFDLVYSTHVLQHMEPRFAEQYVGEFLRVVRPGGLVVFEIPTAPAVVSIAPLAAEDFAAEGTIVSAPAGVERGDEFSLRVRFQNTGRSAWPAFSGEGPGRVEMKYHWDQELDPRGAPPANRHGWSIGQDISVDGASEVTMRLLAPDHAGRWRLHLDLVQVGVDDDLVASGQGVDLVLDITAPSRAWVQVERVRRRAGRLVGRAPAATTPHQASDASLNAEDGVMEMHASSEAEIERWVERGGGRVLAFDNWNRLLGRQPTDFECTLCIASKATS